MSQIPDSANKGLENIIACTTEISTIHDSTLIYRGYAIEDLAANCSFEETIYLLWSGELPNNQQLEVFSKQIRQSTKISEKFLDILKNIAQTNAHPMAKLRTAISFYGMLDEQSENSSVQSFREKGLKLTAAMGPIVASLSRLEQGLSVIPPQEEQSIAENFLCMILGKQPSKEEIKLFDTALVLHADHELNASAFTARVVCSTNSDYYSCITAALGSLKGPLHGGANEQVMVMLKEIGNFSAVEEFINDAVQAKKKVMGIGHRVYKNGDPRARLLKELSLSVCKKNGLEEYHKMLTHIELEMERRKGLMPNVDFYSGLVYTALGLKPRDFTPIFATSRISGWTAQILEQITNNRIYRPRGFYTGKINKKVVALKNR